MEIKNYERVVFENIKHIDKEGNEFWYARELKDVLEYKQWRRFEEVIEKSKNACINSSKEIIDHFADVGKMVKTGDSIRKIKEYKLSRYACYLIVQNSDPRKKVVALGQTYFAVQTRKQELTELEYSELSEIEKRLYTRSETKDKNLILYKIARSAGVKNFDKFTNAGYRGLYNGETADDIARRKKLRYREDILDNMGSDELGINLFRIIQTGQKIVNENIVGEGNSSDAHFEIGSDIRKFIIKHNNTLPENFPTPDKSLKQIEKEKKLIGGKIDGNKKL